MKRHAEPIYFCLFDTEFGVAAIAWTAKGICGQLMAEKNAGATEEKLRNIFPTAIETEPPLEILMLTKRISKHLQGNVQDFSNVRLDLTGVPPFHAKIYRALQKIPVGKTVSYNDLAVICDWPGAARAVGQAISKNPIALIVPCHRVVSAEGTMGGITAYGGLETKRRLLHNENALPPKCAAAITC